MQPGSSSTEPEWLPALRLWRQGDLTTDIRQTVVVSGIENGDLVPEGEEAVGLVVVSQTCDVVNWGADKEWVAVAPLVELPDNLLPYVLSGSTPNWTPVENSPSQSVVANIGHLMTIHKSVLARSARTPGFNDEQGQARFADAISRKYGRFAFPDDFSNFVLEPLKRRIRGAHPKDSDQGRVYRSISECRVVASPGWNSDEVSVGFRFILHPQERLETSRDKIASVVAEHLNKIDWPTGFRPEEPAFMLQTLAEMTAEEWVQSHPIDWQFISFGR